MDAHVGLQISCFDKGPIASDEGAVDGRPFFLARPDDFVVAEVEAETELLDSTVGILDLNNLTVFIGFRLFFSAAEKKVVLAENKILEGLHFLNWSRADRFYFDVWLLLLKQNSMP